MNVIVSTKNCTVPDPILDRVERRVSTLDRFHPRATSASVNFEADHGRKRCEARIHVDGGPPLYASFENQTLRGALDGAVQRLERQLKRQRQRRRQRRSDTVSAAE